MVLGDLVVVGDAVLAMTITLATVDVDRKKLAKEPGLSTEKNVWVPTSRREYPLRGVTSRLSPTAAPLISLLLLTGTAFSQRRVWKMSKTI